MDPNLILNEKWSRRRKNTKKSVLMIIIFAFQCPGGEISLPQDAPNQQQKGVMEMMGFKIWDFARLPSPEAQLMAGRDFGII